VLPGGTIEGMVSSADTVAPESGAEAGTGPYGLEQPTLAEAFAALRRLYGPHTGDIWQSLLARTRLSGTETDLDSFDRVVECMNTAEPITRLCGRGLAIRAAAYRRLAAAHGATPKEAR
jgi:hypothetical protein